MKTKIIPFLISASLLSTSAYAYTDYEDTTETRLLSALNIMTGYEDGSFKPDSKLTRSEALKSIINILGMRESAELSDAEKDQLDPLPYTDLDKSSWDWGYWNTANTLHIINGFDDGTARPNDNVTYAQLIKMLVNAVGYGYYAESTGGYPNGYMMYGARLGLTFGVTFAYHDSVTRKDAAILLSNALYAPLCIITEYQTTETGESVPTYAISDGSNGFTWCTLLEYQNIYKLDVTVQNVQDDTAAVKVESTKNLQGKAYTSSDNKVIDINLNGLSLSKGETASILLRENTVNNTNSLDLIFIY